jgi:hypothetical protein
VTEKTRPATIVAVVESGNEAQLAVSTLASEGLPREAISVLSSEPIHFHHPPQSSADRSLIGIFAVIGGTIGAALALALTIWSSRRVNLITGGMPIVSPWALGVIVFEMTALGAILTSLGRMLFEARLVRRSRLNGYAEAIAEGSVVLSIEIRDDAQAEIARKILGSKLRE